MCRPEHMAEILRYIKKVFPECERVTSYGSPASILCKSRKDLNMLHDLGLEMIYLGLESGSDEYCAASTRAKPPMRSFVQA